MTTHSACTLLCSTLLVYGTSTPGRDRCNRVYRWLHDCQGEVVAVLEDTAGEVTGDERDAILYRVRLDSGTEVDVRWRDLRPR